MNTLWLSRVGVVLALLVATASSAFAQGLADLPERLQRATKGAESAPPDSFSEILCHGNKRDELVRSAQADRIQNPDDFVTALHDMWCDGGDAVQLRKLQARLNVPFTFTGPDEKRQVYRSAKAMRKKFDDMVFAITRSPYYFSIVVDANGSYVKLSTSSEGGGDEYVLELSAGRWKISEFSGGGAC